MMTSQGSPVLKYAHCMSSIDLSTTVTKVPSSFCCWSLKFQHRIRKAYIPVTGQTADMLYNEEPSVEAKTTYNYTATISLILMKVSKHYTESAMPENSIVNS